MRALRWMASLVITLEDDGKTKPECDKINHVNAFFITLYALLTGIFMWNLLSSDYRAVFDGAQSIYASNAGEKLGYLVIHYTLYMVSLASIHMWIYMARRFFVGMYGENGFFRSSEFKKSYEEIWNASGRWFEPFPISANTGFERFIKLLYLAGWLLLCITVMICANNMKIFHFMKL